MWYIFILGKSSTSAVPANCIPTVHKRSVRSAFLGDIPMTSSTEITVEDKLHELADKAEADVSPETKDEKDVPLDELSNSYHNLRRRSAVSQTTMTNKTLPCRKRCRCPCGWDIKQNLTKEEITKKTDELVKKLTINKTTLGATVRSLLSNCTYIFSIVKMREYKSYRTLSTKMGPC